MSGHGFVCMLLCLSQLSLVWGWAALFRATQPRPTAASFHIPPCLPFLWLSSRQILCHRVHYNRPTVWFERAPSSHDSNAVSQS